MSRTNQILIWITLSILAIALTVAYFWPKEDPEAVAETDTNLQKQVEMIVTVDQLVVTVLNGSLKDGMAGKTKEFLEANQIYVTRIGNAPTRDYAVSEIIYHPDSSQAAYDLAKLLNINKRTPAKSFESKLFATVVIGADFKEPALTEKVE